MSNYKVKIIKFLLFGIILFSITASYGLEQASDSTVTARENLAAVLHTAPEPDSIERSLREIVANSPALAAKKDARQNAAMAAASSALGNSIRVSQAQSSAK